MKSLFGLLLLCLTVSLVAAETALPDTKALWLAYQADNDKNCEAWSKAIDEINYQVEVKVLRIDPTYRELDKKMKAMQAGLETTKMRLLNTGLPKKLSQQLMKVSQETQTISVEDNRSREIDMKYRQAENLERQIKHLIDSTPEVVRQQNEINETRAQLFKLANAMINDSPLPAAQVLRDTKAMAKNYFDQNSALLVSHCEATQNPFADLYSNLSHERALDLSCQGYQKYLVTVLTRENPQAAPEKIANFAKSYADSTFQFPGDPKSYLEPGQTPFDELYNAAAANDLKAQNNEQSIRRLRLVTLKMPSPSYTRLQTLILTASLTSDETVKKTRKKVAIEEMNKILTANKVDDEFAPYIYDFYDRRYDDEDWKNMERTIGRLPNLNPWLKLMITGEAARVKAWDNRGNGYGYTVSKEGASGFHRELDNARNAFNAAIKLKPDFPQPYVQLLPVAMGNGDAKTQIKIFKQIIAIDPFNREAYNKIVWGLLPRWCGSLELIQQFGDAALDYPYYDTIIPSYGFYAMGHVAYYYPDYRWKNVYLRDGIIDKGDRLFQQRYQAERNGYWKKFILYHRALFEMATLRYDQAAQTVAELGGEKAFYDMHNDAQWNGLGYPHYHPCILTSDNTAPVLLRLFTGPRRDELRKLEKRYLDGESATVTADLKQLIKTGKFTPEERDALCELYGRWAIDCNFDDYSDCAGNQANALQVAGFQGYPEVFNDMLKLGYDYNKYETYPGQTAVLLAMRGTNPELLEVLRVAGDPLNRPEPKQGRTPIHVVGIQANAPMMKKLLELGCTVDAPDKENHTALQIAAVHGGVETTKMLLAAGADPDKQDNDGDVALFFVMEQNGPRQLWEMLIKKTKNINICDSGSQNVLHHAAEHQEKPDAIRALLAAGADPRKKDCGGNTPADLARKRGRADLAAILDGKQK